MQVYQQAERNFLPVHHSALTATSGYLEGRTVLSREAVSVSSRRPNAGLEAIGQHMEQRNV